MRCTDPRTVGFLADGKTISWSQKTYSKQYATFKLPCGQCLECRLDYARQWAIRCVHEAQMHENNAFITLTYSDEHLKSPYLQYRDFQLFAKKLRKVQNAPIGYFVTGEYGEQNKRPHWHAIIFNWSPSDAKPKYTSDRGDKVYTSQTLENLWGHGATEFGSVTLESAGYCARYAAKKLVHGNDDDHQFQPISKKSSKHAIGKKWLEKYWEDVFNYGNIIVKGSQVPIPRYYERWLKQHQPSAYLRYVTEVKYKKIEAAVGRSEKDQLEVDLANLKRCFRKGHIRPRLEAKRIILEQKINQLLNYLKL